MSGDTRMFPEHELRDVAVAPDGRHGWFMDWGHRRKDKISALYHYDTDAEILMKYPLPDHYPVSIALALDNTLWYTAIPRAIWRENLSDYIREAIHTSVREYSLHRFDPTTLQIATFHIPNCFGMPTSVMVDPDGAIWFQYRSLQRKGQCGISKLQGHDHPDSTINITPSEVSDWTIKHYTLPETEGEMLTPQTFKLLPNQPDKQPYPTPPVTMRKHVHPRSRNQVPSYLFYPLESQSSEAAVDLAGDRQGRIWFTTQNGYIGVLTPILNRRTIKIR
jgi:streptogramin lyase